MNHRLNQEYRRGALLLASAARDDRYKSVLFSSPTPGAGTTTTVLRIGQHLRESHRLNPLVIELNWRKPVFVPMLGLDRTKTLASVADGTHAISECIHHWAGVSVLPAGDPKTADEEIPLNPATVLRTVMDELNGQFDTVLVDSPPLIDDPAVLEAGQVIPRLIVVVEAGAVRYEILERVKGQLSRAEMEVVGAILNKQRAYIPQWLYRWL